MILFIYCEVLADKWVFVNCDLDMKIKLINKCHDYILLTWSNHGSKSSYTINRKKMSMVGGEVKAFW